MENGSADGGTGMLERVSHQPGQKLAVGTKNVSLDPSWAGPAISDIELALLRAAAFPDICARAGLDHEITIVDPCAHADRPGHEDLVERLLESASRMKIRASAVGHGASARFGTGGFARCTCELEGLEPAEFAAALGDMRARLHWVLHGSGGSSGETRHIFIPQFDLMLLALVIDILSEMPVAARPFVHLATRQEAGELRGGDRFGSLSRFGPAIAELNSGSPRLFLYAWSHRLAQQLTQEVSARVQPLDPPVAFSLLAEPPATRRAFTVGCFPSGAPDAELDALAAVAANLALSPADARRSHLIIRLAVDPATGTLTARQRALAEELVAMDGPTITLIEGHLPREAYFETLRELDAVLLLKSLHEQGERISTTAHHAMAAGKLVLTLDDARLSGTGNARVLRASDPAMLGEAIRELSRDLPAVRAASHVARTAYAATIRPSRIFAQLFYGPLILAQARGSEAI